MPRLSNVERAIRTLDKMDGIVKCLLVPETSPVRVKAASAVLHS